MVGGYGQHGGDRLCGALIGLLRPPVIEDTVPFGLGEVILERLERSGADYGMDTRYLADILARTTFALIRSALIRGWQLRSEGAAVPPEDGILTDQAFSTMRLPPAAGPSPTERSKSRRR